MQGEFGARFLFLPFKRCEVFLLALFVPESQAILT